MDVKELSLKNWTFSEETNHIIGIDCGRVNIKVIWTVSRDDDKKSLMYKTMEINELKANIEEIIKTIGEKDLINSVRLTGKAVDAARKIVDKILPGKSVIVDEYTAMSDGFRWLMRNCGEKEIQYKCPTLSVEKIEMDESNPFMKQLNQQYNTIKIEEETTEKNDFRQAVIIWSGQMIDYFTIKKEGSIDHFSTYSFSGESMKGLAKALTDFNAYNDIMTKAMTGQRSNVDTVVAEIMKDDPKSPYGKFPPHLPFFPFGKFMDHDMKKEDVDASDLLASLASLLWSFATSSAIQICRSFNFDQVYLCGALFTHPYFIRCIIIRNMIFPKTIKYKILDCDYAIALGALLQNS